MMSQIIIAIAGYMGSGKTTCTKLLAQLGCSIIDADHEAKLLMSRSDDIKNAISREFGQEMVTPEGIRYSILGEHVFSSIDSIKKFNNIVHPPLIDHLNNCVKNCTERVLLFDAALIPLWKIEHWFNHRLWIHADFEVRLHRLNQLRSRSSINMHQYAHRMKIQEDLFSQPSKELWHYIENEDSERTFFENIMQWVSSVPELAPLLNTE
jgi:dephospho-CoA kinase